MEHSDLSKWSLSSDARQKMVNKIMDTLQKHMPLTGPEGMNDLKKIALRFEEKIYNAAADQQDYLRRISLKMLSLETGSQVPGRNAPGSSQNPLDTGNCVSKFDILGEQSSAMEYTNLEKWSLSLDARQKIVNKIMDTLQKHMPLTDPEGMHDLKKVALRYEEMIYNSAADQQDYLRKISLKMLSLGTRSQVRGSNAPGSSQNPLDTGGMQSAASLASAFPAISNLSQSTGGQGFGTESLMSNSTGQLLSQNALLHQWQMQSRQQQHQQQMVQQHQQSQPQHLLLYQQQQQQHALLEQKLQHSQLVPILQQQQLPVMQQNQQLPTSQQSIRQPVQPPTHQSSQQSLIGHVDLQEKIHQRLQKLKEMYFADINELYMKLQSKSELPMPPDQAEKLQHYKNSLQRFMQYFHLPKSSIPVGTKEEKIDSLEKQVVTMLNLSKHMKPTPQQQGQQQLPPQAGGQVQSQSPLPPMQQLDKYVNQLQQMHLQAPVTSMQPNTTAPIQHSSMQMLQQSGVQTSQQNMGTAVQTGANLNPTQGTGMGAMQQSSVNSLQHASSINSLQQNNSAIQQSNMSFLQHNGINPLHQNNLNLFQSNANSLQNHHQAIGQGQVQVLQIQQQHLQQLQQQKQHATKLQAQFQAQQVPQLQQINDLNDDSELKHAAAMKQPPLQQHHQHSAYQQQQQQFKSGASLPVSSPQLLPTASPQVSQQSSPQVDQQSVITNWLCWCM